MDGLHPIGGGLDAVIASTIPPTAEQRLARYQSALAAHPDRFHGLRVQFGEVQQRLIKSGHRINYAAWQKRMPALWPRHQNC
ncbi:TPA: hypothetical protein UOA81_001907 [Stenotrophomonas maltophilia]|nr:hypothetical protein [Stenotrophomonas maltophilia]